MVILHPVRRFLTSYFMPCRSPGTSVRGGNTITSSSFVTLFLCRSSGTRKHLINQFVTIHFTNRYCDSVDLSKIEAGCRNMPSYKKSSTKFAPSLAISGPSVTSLLLNIAKHYITNRLISLQQEFRMLRLGKLLPHQRPLFS